MRPKFCKKTYQKKEWKKIKSNIKSQKINLIYVAFMCSEFTPSTNKYKIYIFIFVRYFVKHLRFKTHTLTHTCNKQTVSWIFVSNILWKLLKDYMFIMAKILVLPSSSRCKREIKTEEERKKKKLILAENIWILFVRRHNNIWYYCKFIDLLVGKWHNISCICNGYNTSIHTYMNIHIKKCISI